MKEFQKTGRGKVQVEHTERTDRFRYEYDFKTMQEALDQGRQRPLSTNKKVCVVKNSDEIFTTHTHGVLLTGIEQVAVYHRGEKIR